MAKDCDILLPLLTDTIDAALMDSLPKLAMISNYAVGYNNIDVGAATKRGIIVTNTPGVLTDATADLTFTLLLCAARRIVEADKYTREGKFRGWEPMLFLGREIAHKTLGIVGLGRIGSAVAKRARGFEMKILYNDANRSPQLEKECGAEFVSLECILRESDFVSLHVPLLPETTHLIGAKQLSMMKQTAVLVNTSRGPVIDEKALVAALRNKTIWAAGLDVFEHEPAIEKDLLELENVVVVPHIASATIETRSRMAEIAAQNILLAIEGKMPVSLVNPEVLTHCKIKIEGVKQ